MSGEQHILTTAITGMRTPRFPALLDAWQIIKNILKQKMELKVSPKALLKSYQA